MFRHFSDWVPLPRKEREEGREGKGRGDELLSLLLWDRSAHERRLLI